MITKTQTIFVKEPNSPIGDPVNGMLPAYIGMKVIMREGIVESTGIVTKIDAVIGDDICGLRVFLKPEK